MEYKSLKSSHDIDEMYSVWEEMVRYACYPSNMDITDKYFNLLNEYYSNPRRTFSNWNLIQNALDCLMQLSQSKFSIKNKDLLILSTLLAFTHFDAYSCTGFEKSAYESLDILDKLGLPSDDIKIIFSHIVSLNIPFDYDENKNFSYHVFRDSCFYWLHSETDVYRETIECMKQESVVLGDTWFESRKMFIISGLESECLMHTEGLGDQCYKHSVVQNNLLDELNSMPKYDQSFAAS